MRTPISICYVQNEIASAKAISLGVFQNRFSPPFVEWNHLLPFDVTSDRHQRKKPDGLESHFDSKQFELWCVVIRWFKTSGGIEKASFSKAKLMKECSRLPPVVKKHS